MQIFEKMHVKVDPQNVEDCHWLKTNGSSKKIIIKLSKRKDADTISEIKTKLGSLIGINNPVFINNSLYA